MARVKTTNSQRDTVLNHLMKTSLTSMQAFEDYGITRLSAIIFNLRNEGYNIKTTLHHIINNYGNSCVYAEYTLIK